MRLLPIGTAIAALVAVAGCGSTSSSSSGAAAHGPATTVTARQISGAGTILVDHRGAALYAPAQERAGMVRCVGACTSVWKPLTLSSGKPTGPGHLGTVKRPDGTLQVTSGGHPLYSFAPEGPGKVSGDGASDAFAGRHFTWHVVKADGTPSRSASSGSTSTSTGGQGGYAY